jgi:hypothetical protein
VKLITAGMIWMQPLKLPSNGFGLALISSTIRTD